MIGLYLSEDQEYCLPVPLNQMGPWLPRLAELVEDRRFRSHSGIDWQGLIGALRDTLRGTRRGGSTITSQVIRLALPAPRTVATKAREFAQAWRLERRLSKDKIMELYLNRAPLGGTLRGVEAASRLWFGRSAADLSPAQAAMLIGMLRAPTAYRPDLNPQASLRRRNVVLHIARDAGLITDFQLTGALEEPLPRSMETVPQENWLFCQMVKSLEEKRDITSTLDLHLQNIVSGAVQHLLVSQPPEVTAVALLIENSTGAVRAAVPNGRWNATGSQRWVDCSTARRSPGSTLKPFVYALAFEMGHLTPATLMADTPLSLKGRSPRNFDRRFRGPVSAADALVDSLNVPAVRALKLTGGEALLQRLRLAGLKGLNNEAEHYGDALILGGCDVSPLELAESITALARKGSRISPVFIEGQQAMTLSVFRPEAAWLTTSVLADPSRLPTVLRNLDTLRGGVAFKTGTSYGFRDAWTAGWNQKWTLVIWVGDPQGRPFPTLVGLSAAAPAVLEIFRLLPKDSIGDAPSGVSRRFVCSLSGDLPSQWCPARRSEWFIPGLSPSGICQLHRRINKQMVIRWPASLAAFMASAISTSELEITSPLDGASYLNYENPSLLGFKAEGAQQFSWYLNGQYLGTTRANQSLLWPMKAGTHRLAAMDDKGRRTVVTFTVTTLAPSQPLQDLTPSP